MSARKSVKLFLGIVIVAMMSMAFVSMGVSAESPTETPHIPPLETPTDVPQMTPTETPTETPFATPTATPRETATETPVETPTEIPTPTPTVTPRPTLRPTITPKPGPILISSGVVSIAGKPGFVGQEIAIPVIIQRAKNLKEFTLEVVQTDIPNQVGFFIFANETPTETPSETPVENPTPTQTPTETSTETPSETPTETPTGNVLEFIRIDTHRTKTSNFLHVSAEPMLNRNGIRVIANSGRRMGVSGNGVLFNLIYKARREGQTFLRVGNLQGDLSKSVVAKQGGLVTIGTRGIPGDVDLDGLVTGEDALLLLKYLIGKIDLTEQQRNAADITKDGSLTMQDVQEIFRRSLGFSELRNSHIFKARMAQVLSANTVSLQDQTTAVNETILVPVNVQEAADVESFTFDFTYDSSRLEFAGVRTAGTMTDNYLVFGDTVSDGRASIIGTTLASPVSGSGTFLYVELKALSEGSASVNLENLLADLQGATTQSAVITVQAGSGATPTPTATPGEDSDFSLSLGTTTLRAGETGMVEVLLTGLPAPVDTFTFDFVFDSDLLSFLSVSKDNTLSDNASVGSNLVSDGRVTITGVSPIAIQEDGVLLAIQIQAKADAEGSALISLESVKADLQDVIPGSNVVDIQAGVLGDTDGDGMVDALDVLLFSQFWMTNQDSDSDRSDVNNDLVIDQFDLLQLNEYWK